MKRKLAIIITLALMLTVLASCGGNSINDAINNAIGDAVKDALGSISGEDDEGGLNIGDIFGGGGIGGDIDLSGMDGDISKINEYLKSLGLEEDEYGFTQYGVWNSALLPDCVPPEPAGLLAIDRTEYKDKHHEDMMAQWTGDYRVGEIYFPDKNFERSMVMFECTRASLDEFLSGMKSNGFNFGEPYEEYSGRWIYEWVGNGHYAWLVAREDWEDSSKYSCEFNITPTFLPHPKSFNGTALPQFGVVTSYEETRGWGWDNSTDSDVDNFWDTYKDSGSFPDDWNIWYYYDFVTMDEAKAYVRQLEGAGWSVNYEDEDKTWDDPPRDKYYAQLEKDGIYCAVDTEYDGRNNIAVRFGTYAEGLYY